MTRRTLIILLIAAGGALVAAVGHRSATADGWTENNDAKTLKFSHKFHVTEANVACEDCHGAAKTSTSASDNLRSTHDNCVTCHEEQINNTCAYCHLNPENIEAATPPVRTIIFSHKQHVTDQGVACATCHAGIDSVDYVTSKNMPAMTTCATCHNDVKATSVCEACHTSFTGLVPADHLVADFKKNHKKHARVGGMEASCATCHTQSFCADCHAGGALVQFGKGDAMSDPAPRTSTADSPNQMALTMTHSLNYRFTHGIDAKSKSSDCYSCHSAQTFCAPCHATGGNINGQPFKPAWHLGAGFTTLGVGSGGGRHAEFAKRDIESCVSCHDVQGGDPTCVTCHRDADGIRGTDPRTHPAGYMKGEHGPWHINQGATCYNCHTDFNARPDGMKGRNFCGYCHG